MWSGDIIGPNFFENENSETTTVNGDTYHTMISNYFLPAFHLIERKELWRHVRDNWADYYPIHLKMFAKIYKIEWGTVSEWGEKLGRNPDWRVIVCYVMCSEDIVGPYFFKNENNATITINGDTYRIIIYNFFPRFSINWKKGVMPSYQRKFSRYTIYIFEKLFAKIDYIEWGTVKTVVAAI